MHSEGRYMCAFRLLTTRLRAEERQWRCTWAISERGQKCNVGRQRDAKHGEHGEFENDGSYPIAPKTTRIRPLEYG